MNRSQGSLAWISSDGGNGNEPDQGSWITYLVLRLSCNGRKGNGPDEGNQMACIPSSGRSSCGWNRHLLRLQGLLVLLDRLEELGEVALPKSAAASLLVLLPPLLLHHASNPLDDLQEDRWPAGSSI